MDAPANAPSSDDLNVVAFFEALCDAYAILDANLRIVIVNRKFLDLTGRPRDELVGAPVSHFDLIGASEQQASRAHWISAACGELHPGETKVSPPLAGAFAPSGGGAPVFQAWEIKASRLSLNVSSAYFTLQVTDVTARVEQEDADKREKAQLRSQAQLRRLVVAEKEQQLEEGRERFAQALAFARVGAWERDLMTGAVTCTAECNTNFGLRTDEALTESRLFRDLIDPLDRERVRDALESAIQHGTDYRIEYRITWPDGSRHWLMVGGRARYDGDGQPTQMLGFVFDITARKEQEREQHRIAGDERLAREQSDRNALAMDHFLTTVSHELRSPIGVILNWAEFLQRSGFARNLELAATTLQRNAKQLAVMVDDLLDSGAIVSGKLSIELKRLRLDTLVEDVVNDLRPQAEQKGLGLTIGRLECSSVSGDTSRLRQVAWNLINNAIKFTENGSIDVSVWREGSEVVLRVSDTGCGITPHLVDRVFERFEQVNPRSSGRVGGLGLGLWLVKTLVERHNGHVSAQSEGLGRGAVFSASFPVLG